MPGNHFTTNELKCPCCGECHMDDDFMTTLNEAREIYGHPILVSSGFRCEKHNKETGSTSTNHTKGKAIDAECSSSTEKFKLVECFILAGMFGIGVGLNYVHGDTNHEKPTMWIYPQQKSI
jgi:zinc D-Ala-D-Ala carboxypeptidase